MRVRSAVILLAVLPLILALAAVPAAAEPDGAEPFVVRLTDPPLASYRGGIAGLDATSPAALGEARLDVDAPGSLAYLAHLAASQDGVVAGAAIALGRTPEVEHRYRFAYNGLALRITAAEADTVRRLPGVAQVQAPVERRLLTDAGPSWIGAPSLWDGSAGPAGGASQGEGVVVGVIDTGVNHDHPSFAEVGGDGYTHANPRGRFYGLCDPLTGLPFCNDKLIGAHDFTGTGPTDDNGHGSHTASTAAGNALTATVSAPTLELEQAVSGVAPHANLITYKACLPTGQCLSPSLVAAIDQATADGVDVINYSIGGGSSDPWSDADARAFLGARDAGVFVASSAGNSGPGAATIGSPADAPWVLGVGAATHDRAFLNAVTDMTGGATAPPADITGNSFTSGYGPAAIVHAADHGDDGQCLNPFPPGTFDGEIVICDRGTIPRVDKGRNVATGGAGGLVLSNTAAEGDSTVADPHVLPAVHIGFTDAQTLESWVRDGGGGHTASIAGTTADRDDANGDITAGFSSRGENPSVPGVVKPDVIAPGVDILAAVHTTDPTAGPEFGLLSGTSMSSPHAAGAAALVRALQPSWTPAQVQSAMMSTSLDDVIRKEDGVTPGDAFDEGAGRIDLTSAARAGLLLDATTADYEAANPAVGGDPTAINLASLGDGDCQGECAWTRVVSNAGDTATTWRATTEGPRGLGLVVSPRQFTLQPGEEQVVKVSADVAGQPIGQWLFGAVRFSPRAKGMPGSHWPVAVAPGGAGGGTLEVDSHSAQGSVTETFTSPVDVKDLTVTVSGLQQGTLASELLEQDPTPLDPYDTELGTFTTLVDVPEGARLLAAEITDTTSVDLDLYVGLDADGDGRAEASEEVCASATAEALESCGLTDPDGGSYWVLVQNWLSGRVVDEVDLVVSVVPGSDAGNLDVSGPKRVAAGADFDLTFTWDVASLEPGEAWFGLVELGSSRRSTADVGSLLFTLRNPG
jgi:subtilisin family serine protease